LIPGGIFAAIRFTPSHEFASDEIKILAEVAHVFVLDRICSSIAALMGCTHVIADTVQANSQIRATTMA
jgi:hypothetical protein